MVPLPVIVPLIATACSLLAVRHPRMQRVISFVGLTGALAASLVLVVHVDRNDAPAVARLGGWPASIAITYVVDRLAGLMLVVTFAMLLVVLVYAVGARGTDEASPYYHPAYLALAGGICAAFLSGDLFHLFVAFEVLLLASYVLLTLNANPGQVRTGTTYVVLNIVESMLLLTAIGLIYGATGTLSMADLPERLAALDPGTSMGLHLLLLIAFGMKAAVFPLFFWLPDSYPTAPSPVTAVFAGLLTKVGVYALIRTQTLLFPDQLRTLLAVVAAATMIIGVLGAIAQSDIKRILSFHIVSQIGYMVLGLAIGGPAAVAATVFFLLHQIPIKTSLFLVEGIVSRTRGTSALDRLSGLARSSGVLGLLFLLPALSLAGLPPFSGFIAKLGLVQAGIDDGHHTLIAIALIGSLLTLVSMTKIWTNAFWGVPDTADHDRAASQASGEVSVLRQVPIMTSATAVLVAAGIAIAAAAGPLYGFCERLATEITDTNHSSNEESS
ncbi:MAG: proton-conducting transporter membrane subunit [Ilumatobacteraceae bacterium]